MSTENIVKFLQTAYSDERLAELLAHCQDGKLAFRSCCCFIGISTADHALAGANEDYYSIQHYMSARSLPFAKQAEEEVCYLADMRSNDSERNAQRRAKLIPLILAEIERRDKEKQPKISKERINFEMHLQYLTRPMGDE